MTPVSSFDYPWRVYAVGIVEDMRFLVRSDRLFGRLVPWEPIAEYLTGLHWNSPNDDLRLRSAKGIVVYAHPVTGSISTVLAVSSPVHIKAVTKRSAQFHVVSSLIAAPRTSRPCYRMAVEIEEVSLDQRSSYVQINTVAQPVILTMVDEIVVDMVPLSPG